MFNEPPIDPQEDTHPTGIYRQVPTGPSPIARLIGLVSLLAAFGLTAATIMIALQSPEDEVIIDESQRPADIVITATPQQIAGSVQPTEAANTDPTRNVELVLPTLSSNTAQQILEQPAQMVVDRPITTINRSVVSPFTVIPDRPRNEIITYEVQQGDTIDEIAKVFGLQAETIAWSNPRRIVQVLRPGDQLLIPPVDGVITTTVGVQRTIADYAALYKIDDPLLIIDSPFNQLAGYTPDTVPPSGTRIFFPGGQAEEIVWNSVVEVSGGTTGAGGSSVTPTTITVDRGQPGSCGATPIGGGTFWSNPVPSGGYLISRGFSSYHPGIDLAKDTGIPIAAANGGTIAFAGWHNGGYGNMIAIVHGPTLTVYGHLSQINVSCGQGVASGQIIGLMGSTGNSSGPHLHFEIRSGSGYSIRQDPAATIGF